MSRSNGYVLIAEGNNRKKAQSKDIDQSQTGFSK